ncbi:MAG: cellulose biosynthesis protein [Burkholderiaceae bacterium]|nr:cellulose biosynthesis protein [Burkholderiaceae bacterium]
MFTVAIISAAGGTGRSTLVANLATLLAKRGTAAFALEFDPQNLLATLLGNDVPASDGLLTDFIANKPFGASALRNSDGVTLLPFGYASKQAAAGFEQHLRATPAWLHDHLAQIDFSDEAMLLIDTPRLPSLYACQAVMAADLVLSVLMPDVRAMALLPAAQDVALTDCGCQKPMLHVINGLDSTREYQRQLAAELRERLQQDLVPDIVHRDTAIAQALANSVSVVDASPDSLVVHDMNGVLNALLARREAAGGKACQCQA